ncbi:MAG: hypothetical protein WCH75_28140 [Candidatus Binatia bacterium]
MKRTAIVVAAAMLGFGIAFWLFAAAFNLSALEFTRQAMLPLGLTMGVSLSVALLEPAAGKSVVIALCLPTVLWNSSNLVLTGDWGHAFVAFALIGAAAVGAWIGDCVRR